MRKRHLNNVRSGSNIRIQTAHPPLMTPAQTAVTATTPFTLITGRHDLHTDFFISASINPVTLLNGVFYAESNTAKKDAHRFPLIVGEWKLNTEYKDSVKPQSVL